MAPRRESRHGDSSVCIVRTHYGKNWTLFVLYVMMADRMIGSEGCGKMFRKREKNSRFGGFTLVELVVVLVILAILMAILVPSLVGYIQKAKVQQAFAECRSCVIAAQSIASEKYGKDKALDWSLPYTEVTDLAEVPGTINADINTNDEKYLVTYLEYKTGSTIVIYERGHDPEYYLADGSIGGTAEKDVSGLSGYAKAVQDYPSLNADRWAVLREWMEATGETALPQVSASVVEKAGYGDATMYWRPYYIGPKSNPQVIYYANTDNMKNADGSWKKNGNWNAGLVMINGVVYYNTNGKADGTSISGMYTKNDYNEAAAYIKTQGFKETK